MFGLAHQAAPANFIFQSLSEDDVARIGVPADWMLDVRAATEERYFEIAGHLPGEAADALLEYAATGMLPATALRPPGASRPTRPAFPAAPPAESMEFWLPRASLDPYAHPDALRRIWTIENAEDLERALELPWE